MSFLKMKNIYYLKKNKYYLIISSVEFDFLFDFYMNSDKQDDFKNINIFDKKGRLITFSKNEDRNANIDYQEILNEPTSYFIKYILGSNLSIYEYIYMFNLLKKDDNLNEILFILDTFKKIYNINYSYENYFRNFNSNNNDDSLKNLIKELEIKNDEIIDIFYKLIIEFNIDIENDEIKSLLKKILEKISDYLLKEPQDGGFNFLNFIINQLGGYKKNSRLNNGKELIKKFNFK
jgi:hypothetical protein